MVSLVLRKIAEVSADKSFEVGAPRFECIECVEPFTVCMSCELMLSRMAERVSNTSEHTGRHTFLILGMD